MNRSPSEQDRIVTALRRVGVEVTDVWDLVNTRQAYPRAIPLLIDFIKEGSADRRTLEALVRALTVKEARGLAGRPLVQLFRSRPHEENNSLKWAIGNALSVVADESLLDDIITLVTDRQHGRSRQMLAEALGTMKSARAVEVLIELLEDEEVAGHAVTALGKLRARRARTLIERFLKHPTTWIRNQAKQALARIDKV